MVDRILFVLLFCVIGQISYLQGLKLDSEISNDHSKLDRSRADRIPKIATLKDYTPYVMMQQNSTCVAYSIATARTILFARNHDIKSKDTITALYYSPHWVYYLNKDDYDFSCNSGLNLEKSLKHILSNGIPRMALVEYPNFYPFTDSVLCVTYPPQLSADALDAQEQSIDKVYQLSNLEDVKIAISRGMPVVFGMKVNSNFQNTLGQDVWLPLEEDNDLKTFGHAMVIVGYNDYKYGGSVQILNSWGEEWGNKGYIWIRYSDLLDYITRFVYALDKQNNNFGASATIDSDQVEVDSSSNYRKNSTLARFSDIRNVIDLMHFNE